jgi:outer membrane immunogenic protein
MRRTLVGFIAALALGSVSSAAYAADMAVPEPAPVMSWTGFYLGAGGGVAWADLDVNHKHCLLDDDDPTICDDDFDEFRRDFNDSSDAGIIGIVQGGFDWEVAPSFVVGVGADWTFGDVLGDNERKFHDDDFGFDHHFNNDNNFLVDVYGRAGFAPTQNLLIFGLVGWTWADIESDFRVRDDAGEVAFHNNDDFNANGISFGGGVEWKFTDNLSIRGEYRFTDLDNFDNNGNFEHCDGDWCGNFRHRNDVDIDIQRVLFTLNWRFGGFGAATAAAY